MTDGATTANEIFKMKKILLNIILHTVVIFLFPCLIAGCCPFLTKINQIDKILVKTKVRVLISLSIDYLRQQVSATVTPV